MDPVIVPVSEIPRYRCFGLPVLPDRLQWTGDIRPAGRLFEACFGESRKLLSVMRVVRSEDGAYWDSCLELLQHTVKSAQAVVSGSYELKILAMEARGRWQHFNPVNLASLLVNHARKMAPSRYAVFPYAPLLVLLRRLAPGDYGKITLDHGVFVDNKNRHFEQAWTENSLKEQSKNAPGSGLIFLCEIFGPGAWLESALREEDELLGSLRAAGVRMKAGGAEALYVTDGDCCMNLINSP